MRAMHGAKIAIDDMRLVVERVLSVESEELISYGNLGVDFGGNRREQVESAAEFLVKDRAGQVVAALRTAAQKEPAAYPIIRLIDCDVLAGHVSVPDEKRGRRQSAEPAANDMRLHCLLPRPPVWEYPNPSPLKQVRKCELNTKANRFQAALVPRDRSWVRRF